MIKDDKPYILVDEKKYKLKNRYNKFLLFTFYLLVIVIGIISFYAYRLDKYEFYLKRKSVLIDIGNSYQVELIPKNIMLFDFLNYNYEISNKDIAKVDEYGNVTGLVNGVTELKVKYKNSLTYKTMKINVGNIDVTSIDTIDKISIKTFESYKIDVKINNHDNVNAYLDFTSDDSSIASVDNYGNIYGHKVGETNITIFSLSGVTKTIHVIVSENNDVSSVETISLSEQNISLIKGSKYKLNVIINPDSYLDDIKWSSDNDNIKVLKDGTIEAKKIGTSIVKATTSSGNSSSCVVTITDKKINIDSINLNITSSDLNVGDSIFLFANITPKNATIRNITWKSSNNKVATVNNGKVTAVGIGSTIITATSSNGKTSTCKINVSKNNIVAPSDIMFISNSPIKLDIGSTFYLQVNITPSNADKKGIIWNSSNSNVASIDNGKIIALESGTTIITAKINNGKFASCIVTVFNQEFVDEIEIEEDEYIDDGKLIDEEWDDNFLEEGEDEKFDDSWDEDFFDDDDDDIEDDEDDE